MSNTHQYCTGRAHVFDERIHAIRKPSSTETEVSTQIKSNTAPNIPNRAATSCDIVLVAPDNLFRECLLRTLDIASVGSVQVYTTTATLPDLDEVHPNSVLLLSLILRPEEEAKSEMSRLSDLGASARAIVLSAHEDLSDAATAFANGAKGYISIGTSLDLLIDTLRFIAVGGTYVPVNLVATERRSAIAAKHAGDDAVTGRELAVIEAIRQGKSNKVIAYDLNMCESTVKVHVRHVMKKLSAKNRTDLAIKSAFLFGADHKAR